MALYSNGVEVAGSGTVRGSAANLTSIPAPTNSQILTGVASGSAGSVGTYGLLAAPDINQTNQNGRTFGQTLGGSNLKAATAQGQQTGGTLSGTWRCMGRKAAFNGDLGNSTTVWLRIS